MEVSKELLKKYSRFQPGNLKKLIEAGDALSPEKQAAVKAAYDAMMLEKSMEEGATEDVVKPLTEIKKPEEPKKERKTELPEEVSKEAENSEMVNPKPNETTSLLDRIKARESVVKEEAIIDNVSRGTLTENKSITFDKKAQENLPQEIKDRMKKDKAEANIMKQMVENAPKLLEKVAEKTASIGDKETTEKPKKDIAAAAKVVKEIKEKRTRNRPKKTDEENPFFFQVGDKVNVELAKHRKDKYAGKTVEGEILARYDWMAYKDYVIGVKEINFLVTKHQHVVLKNNEVPSGKSE